MGRPADSYTHSQFVPVASENLHETVQCIHCKKWSGYNKILNRKRDHLLKCPEYLAWRAAGNGQDIAPAPFRRSNGPNLSIFAVDPTASSPTGSASGTDLTPSMARARPLDVNLYFDEWFEDDSEQKCARVRCKSCGFSRAKNTTRMTEHLVRCKDFLATTDGQGLVTSGVLSVDAPILSGSKPNPNLFINRRGPNRPRGGMAGNTPTRQQVHPMSSPQVMGNAPSLANHLLNKVAEPMIASTQNPFLSHAGCGSLTASALNQWLAQVGYISRSLISFTGSLIGKTRIPETANLQKDPIFRCLDLLCSAVNNMKKELEFLEATKRKYGLQVAPEEPSPATKGFVDLFNGTAHPTASLLEGMVLLWATEHLLYTSFTYAGNFVTRSAPPPQTPYSLPTYLNPQLAGPAGGYTGQTNEGTHINALREAFIENWRSDNFRRFVEACKSIVDELANAQTSGNGRTEMLNCERSFHQAVWLWGQIFPVVTGMGEEEELQSSAVPGGVSNGNGTASKPAHISDNEDEVDEDRDADATADSPFGGTGLGAVAAANNNV